ncbi:MAG: hydrogenase maturation nickel metallochaperone HypA [Burkholderiaceae bacterium]|jgi:hydrogenase nickel incorporation protein HypA/HybF|nr:hydrogenase maturation nickel metallochaperone HypA [Burkholderiaceae bacterium]
MHEMSLAESIRDLIETQARKERFNRVRTVELEIGQLASVDSAALRFALDIALRGTPADGAELVIAEPAGQAWCMHCARTVELAQRGDGCPACGGYQLAVTGGDQMRVSGLLVD